MGALTKQDNTYIHKNKGVCSSAITFEVEDHKLKNVNFIGGCSGNTKGISKLVEGMDISDVISRLEGVTCGMKPTSCPDQLAKALKAYQAELAQ
ncbi:MAG: TIGR03905 family TSCPD domain-containing protein [Muricoprocola sp.]